MHQKKSGTTYTESNYVVNRRERERERERKTDRETNREIKQERERERERERENLMSTEAEVTLQEGGKPDRISRFQI